MAHHARDPVAQLAEQPPEGRAHQQHVDQQRQDDVAFNTRARNQAPSLGKIMEAVGGPNRGRHIGHILRFSLWLNRLSYHIGLIFHWLEPHWLKKQQKNAE
ncbi:hypothetical protein D3C77_700460 [compost metagenome]